MILRLLRLLICSMFAICASASVAAQAEPFAIDGNTEPEWKGI